MKDGKIAIHVVMLTPGSVRELLTPASPLGPNRPGRTRNTARMGRHSPTAIRLAVNCRPSKERTAMTHLDTYATVVDVEHRLMVSRAERRAPLVAAMKLSRPTPAGDHGQTVAGSRVSAGGHLVRMVRSLRWVLRPAHA